MFEKFKNQSQEKEKSKDYVIKDPKELIESEKQAREMLAKLYFQAEKGNIEMHHEVKNNQILKRYARSLDGKILFYEDIKAIEDFLKKRTEELIGKNFED